MEKLIQKNAHFVVLGLQQIKNLRSILNLSMKERSHTIVFFVILFKCHLCNGSFARKDTLKLHLESKIHEGKKITSMFNLPVTIHNKKRLKTAHFNSS